jgi:hypothetical protein
MYQPSVIAGPSVAMVAVGLIRIAAAAVVVADAELE